MDFLRFRGASSDRSRIALELAVPAALCVVLTVGCGGAGASGSGAEAAGGPQAQIELGEDLFRKQCAPCHGRDGRSGQSPPVIGEGALPEQPPSGAKMRSVQFKTAADLLGWTKQKMPPGSASALSDAEHTAIVAFMLTESGKSLGGRPLDASSAATISLANR